MNRKSANVLVDEFLESRKLCASDNFCELLEGRLASEKLKDSVIDDFVSSQPLRDSGRLSRRIFKAVAAFRRAEAFKKIGAFAAACAASIAISYLAFFYSGPRISEQLIASEFASLDSEISNFDNYASELESFKLDFYDYDLSLYSMR